MTSTDPGADVDELDGAELYDPRIPRVDAVAGPAHGIRFHIVKAGSGRLTKEQQSMADDLADTVKDGHKRADTDPAAAGDAVDVENDPAAQTPGSPAWEAIDAAKAREGLVGLVAVKQLVEALASREDTEVRNGGDADDAENVCDLDAATSALDFALGVLSKFAVLEQAEADAGLAELEAEAELLGLKKALDVERVLKAGRVLSQQNEQALNQARQILDSILGQLEKAPVAAEGGEPVNVKKAADLSAMPVGLSQLFEQFLAAFQAWQQAGDDPTAVDGTAAADSTDAPDAGDAAAPAPDTAEEAAPVADPTTEPAPAPETPAGDAPAAAPAPAPAPAPEDEHVQKSQSDPADGLVERLLKSMSDAVKEAVSPLEERIAKMEAQPADHLGPMLAGQLPAPHQLRGHDAGAAGDDPLDGVRKQLAEIDDPQQRAALGAEAAIAAIQARIAGRG